MAHHAQCEKSPLVTNSIVEANFSTVLNIGAIAALVSLLVFDTCSCRRSADLVPKSRIEVSRPASFRRPDF